MSTNLFARLKSLLPPPGVVFGRVVEHHAEDDTSTLELPTGLGATTFGPGVAAGSTIRARGRTVEVGKNAFVRSGVVESQAPDGEVFDIEVGVIVPTVQPPTPLVFAGPIPAIVFPVGVATFVPLAGYWSGGYPPYPLTTNIFSLPPGISLNIATGLLGGTASAAAAISAITVSATDQTAVPPVPSNAFNVSAA